MTNYNTARINDFCSNEDNFVAIDYNDPRAVAIRAAARRRFASDEAKRAAALAASEEKARGFAVGQIVAMKNRPLNRGPIAAINGDKITVEINGSARTFTAAMLVAA